VRKHACAKKISEAVDWTQRLHLRRSEPCEQPFSVV
jgi:hypothetical protein